MQLCRHTHQAIFIQPKTSPAFSSVKPLFSPVALGSSGLPEYTIGIGAWVYVAYLSNYTHTLKYLVIAWL
ncbi:hypothetical protein METHB2_90002 [Candidatus Methylobacter favarea]|uniref:Uncharacterized protein n=1 Tax=Candidatus Methylobacter favarea TaxID=2707345 RepID=A0A8S0WD11_9GAMM|nr:hypothetical protein METHB2_90002 [Candidatus Methylobacter favarea]